MARAAVYARYSSHSQREESIEDQVRVCTERAAASGDEIVAVYADSAKTGTNDDRPEFRRMIAAAERGEWAVLYIYKQDRFARNRYDAASNKMRLRRAGVRIETVAEHIPEGPDGVLMESLLEGLAEYYSANLAQNIRRGIEGNAQRCMANGRRIFGYRTGDDGRYEIDEDEARVVRRLFGEYASGATMREAIATVGPVKTRGGAALTPGYVSKMLRREAYVGVYEYSGHRTEGGMPAIVDRETFDAVQERLGKHPKHRRPAKDAYPLSGKLFDEDGNAFSGSSGTSCTGRPYRYYRCLKTGASASADDVESAVSEGVLARLGEDGSKRVVSDLIMQAYVKEVASEIEDAESVERRLAAIDREEDRAVDAIVKIGATDKLTTRIVELREERESLRRELADIRRGIPVVTEEMISFWYDNIAACPDVATLAASFVHRVTVLKDGRLFVEFLLMDEKEYEPSSKASFAKDDSSYLFPMVEARRIELRSMTLP